MSSLENILNNLRDNDSKEVHKDFRIFITSMPASYVLFLYFRKEFNSQLNRHAALKPI